MPTVGRGVYRWLFQGGSSLEDFADRLNHFWTVGILLIFAAIISWKQGISDPIACWCPAEFTHSMTQYVHTHCWHSHYIQYFDDILEAQDMLNESSSAFMRFGFGRGGFTPYVGFNFPLEPSPLKLYSTKTTLYQWLPLILVIQALLFKLPHILFYCFHGYTGINFDKISGLTKGVENLNLSERASLTRQIGRYVYNWCGEICSSLPWRFLTVAWLLTKILFFCNIVTQMFYLNRYLRTLDPPLDNSSSYGDVIMGNLFTNNGSIWRTSPMFPRHVMCDFEIRQMRNIHMYTVECDLPMNEFSEIAFIFLWIWFLIVAIVTSISLTVWVIRVAIPVFRQRYILKMLNISDEFSNLKNYETTKFADYIGEDGVMALKLIGSNSSDLIVSDVVCHMWRQRMQAETRPVPTAHVQVQPEVMAAAPSPVYPDVQEEKKCE